MSRSSNAEEIHQTSQSESSMEESQNQSQKSGRDFLPSKKKRIVRKKYKPRKKDVLIHTICILNKNNFRPQNSIIETFFIADSENSLDHSKKSVQKVIERKNEEYLKKIMVNIKFSQNLTEKRQAKEQQTNPFGYLSSIGGTKMPQNQQKFQQKWPEPSHNSFFPSFPHSLMPMYMNFAPNPSMYN